ncbi:unnamed protein product [Effrenium voratum]|nr:unnamed protein product [Effrenium voratum]
MSKFIRHRGQVGQTMSASLALQVVATSMRTPLHLGGPAHWWQAYDDATSRTIEQAHKQGQATVRIALKNGQYDIDLKKMQQVHATRPSKTQTIRREDGQASSTASTCSAATSARSVRSSGSSTDELSLVSQMQVLHMQIPCCSVASEDEKSSVQLQFSKKWDTSRESEPSISEIYTIHALSTWRAASNAPVQNSSNEAFEVPEFPPWWPK